MTPTLKTFVLNKMRAYLCSKMFLCAIENALGLLVSCLKNRPIFYKNIGAYTDGLLLKNIFIGLSNDPNFSIAVADGHRQFVAHKKFQQQLHRQWQEQRRSDQLLKKRMFQRYCK